MSDTPPAAVLCWFEIPVADLERAQRFYQTVLDCTFTLEPAATGDSKVTLAMFGSKTDERPPICGCLIAGTPLQPSTGGTVIYFNVGPDLALPLERAVAAGGTVLVPKTAIGPYGFFAHILDSEGNRIGLHSLT